MICRRMWVYSKVSLFLARKVCNERNIIRNETMSHQAPMVSLYQAHFYPSRSCQIVYIKIGIVPLPYFTK